jgi:uroporphyrinogen decarboxylase
MVGERGLVHLYINSPLDHQAGWAVDLPDLMVACYDDPQFVTRLLQLFHEHTMAEISAALEMGVEVIFTPWYFASLSAGWSPRLYETFFLPLLREQVALVHQMGGLYHYYDDGAVMRILPWLAEAGIDLLSSFPPPPMGDFDMAKAKAQFGDKICFNGNIDLIHVIKNGNPPTIHSAVRQLILEGAPGGGFILGTSDSIRDTELGNVRAFFEAARKYGDYTAIQEISYAES